jgi:hypothetical protein
MALTEIAFGYVRPCTGNAYVVYPGSIYNLPLDKCASALRRRRIRVRLENLMLNIMFSNCSCTLYRTGRLLVTPCSSEQEALRIARELFGMLVRDRALAASFSSAEAI